MDERPRIGFFIVIVIIALLVFVALRSTPATADSSGMIDRLTDLFAKPQTSNVAPNDVFGPVDEWSRNVSGLSLTQILMAIWRILVWVFVWALAVVWSVVGWLRDILTGK